jgi:hypothetical protein
MGLPSDNIRPKSYTYCFDFGGFQLLGGHHIVSSHLLSLMSDYLWKKCDFRRSDRSYEIKYHPSTRCGHTVTHPVRGLPTRATGRGFDGHAHRVPVESTAAAVTDTVVALRGRES